MEADPLAIVEIVGMAGHASIWLEDWDARLAVLSRVLGAARAASAVSALIHPLAVQAHLDLRRGRWAPALAGASESAELAEDTGQLALLPHALAALTLVEAGLGHETDCRRHVARGLELAGGDADTVYLHAALGLLELGLGRIPEAIEALETGERQMLRRGLSSAVVQLRADLIEAYVRAGRREEAEAVLARLRGATPASRARATRAARAARCRGLLRRATPERPRAAFDAALALHDGPADAVRARAHAARARRAAAARQAARRGARAADRRARRVRAARRAAVGRARADRAARHRRAGERAPRRRPRPSSSRRTSCRSPCSSRQGMTNREAAAALFLSPKTIEYHLGQIYRKLDVRGRAQLARLMAMELPEGERDPAVLADALS